MIKVLQASITFAGLTPAIQIQDSWFISGNAIYEIDVLSAISHCEQMGYSESDIVIDSIISGPKDIATFDGKYSNAFRIQVQASVMTKYYDNIHGVLRAQLSHSKVLFRYVIGPSFNMPNKILPMQYNLKKAKDLLVGGQRDVARTLTQFKQNPQSEYERRINGPNTIFYYNKERQSQHEAHIKA